MMKTLMLNLSVFLYLQSHMNVGKRDSVSMVMSRMILECLALPKLVYLLYLNFYVDLCLSKFIQPSIDPYAIRICGKELFFFFK